METKTIENTALTMYSVNKTDDFDFIKSYAAAVYDILSTCYNGSKTEIPGSVSDMLSLIDSYKLVMDSENQIYAVALYQDGTCYRIAKNIQYDVNNTKLAVNIIIKTDHPEYEDAYYVLTAFMYPILESYNVVIIPSAYAVAILDRFNDTTIVDTKPGYKVTLYLDEIDDDMPEFMFMIPLESANTLRLLFEYWLPTLIQYFNNITTADTNIKGEILSKALSYISDHYIDIMAILTPDLAFYINKILAECQNRNKIGLLTARDLSDIEFIQAQVDYSTIFTPRLILR